MESRVRFPAKLFAYYSCIIIQREISEIMLKKNKLRFEVNILFLQVSFIEM